MPVTKIAHFANAPDVDTVIVDGQLLMQARRIAHLDESAILDEAAAEAKLAFDRAALSHFLVEPRDYWSVSKRLDIETKG
jgi:hypothetical protein